MRRVLEPVVRKAAKAFPAVVITGPRRAGKTELLRHAFKDAQYVLLEDPDVLARAKADPRGLLAELKLPVVLDEIQNAPWLFAYVRSMIDAEPRRTGRWFFTGSQEAPLMQGVGESMAGRAAVLQLLPMSLAESNRVSLLDGGYPEVLARRATRDIWFASYLQTYLERDVRGVINVRDVALFRRFLALVASRHGQLLDRSALAGPLGVTVPTVSDWLSVLEITGQVILVPPYFENFGKRLIKSPKLYWSDPGMVCYLLGIRSAAELERSPFLGSIFEGFVASEIVKSQINRGGRKEIYFFRDYSGLEVDFLVPGPGQVLWMVECKASRTVTPAMAAPMFRLPSATSRERRQFVVHRRGGRAPLVRALAEGTEAFDLEAFVELLKDPARPAKGKRPASAAPGR